jgi:hypothetical protein
MNVQKWMLGMVAAGALAAAQPAAAQVLLANFTTPATAMVGTPVVISGCGFPAGMQAVNTLVTFTPAPGAGQAVTATADAVTVKLGNCYDISVTTPTNIVGGLTALTVANAATSTPVFSSANFSDLTITGAPSGITLNAPQPASALPGTVVTMLASGFNAASPIPAGNVMVLIHPASGPTVAVPASQDPFTAPGVMQVSFLLPSGIAAGAAELTLQSQAGTTPPFVSINQAAFEILEQATGASPLGPVSPATVAAGKAVSVKANGMPAGTIAAGNILVTLTPPPGNGAPITVPATLYLAAVKTINFPVSTGLVNNAPLLCAVTVTNKPGTLPAFALTGTTVTVTPPPTVQEVTPAVGQQGTAVAVEVLGDFTHFGSTSTLSFTPFGQTGTVSTITANNVSIASTTTLHATLNIANAATPGAYTVNVTTGTEVAHSGAALVVTTSPGLAFGFIAPNGAALGQHLSGVHVQAVATHFVQGQTVLDFGDGITVSNLQVTSPTDLLADLDISPTTTLGARTVMAVTGGEFALGVNAFTVQASAAALVAPLTPNQAPQGGNLVGVQIQGTGTHFLPGATQVAIGGGVLVGQVTVVNPTSLTVDLSVPPGASVGAQDVTVTTGGEVVGLSGAFTVLAATPKLTGVTPLSAAQGTQNLDVIIGGQFTNFQPGQVSVSFGDNGITVNSVTVDAAAQTVDVNISIAIDAALGGRTGTLVSATTLPTTFNFGFSVTPSSAAIASVCLSPSGPPTCITGSPQNSAPTLLVTGVNTHWVQGTTHVTAGLGLNIGVITITSPTTAVLETTIPPGAPVGGVGITFATGGEIVSGSFNILASTPSMKLDPPQGLQGTSVAVNFTGSFTHWCDNQAFACAGGVQPTAAAIDGSGVSIQNFVINSPASAAATLVIAPGATLGGRNVTLATGLETVSASFYVTNTPAALIRITPGQAGPADTVAIAIFGQYTHFESGVTTLTAGPDITVSNLVVQSATELTATLAMDGQAALGWRSLFVNTVDAGNALNEQLSIGFDINSPALPVFTGLSPSSGEQGQVLTVTMTGVNTHWQQGVTQALVGAEVTVNSLTINSATSATAVVTISPYAPLTGNPIVMITGSDVDSGPGLGVVPGPARVLGLCRNVGGDPADARNTCAAGPVLIGTGQTITVNLTGQATHWLQGATVAQIGNGQVYTDSFQVVDPTHAVAQLTVLSTANPGFQPVTLTTLGEVASIAQGLDLVNSAPTLLSTVPNAGQQGTTLNVQVLGRFTHWCDNVNVNCAAGYAPTVAVFGQDIATINSITVQDSETAVLNVTVDPLTPVTGAPCPALTMTTGTEQVTLSNGLCVTPGGATITSVTPNSGPQGQTTTVQVTGQFTHFIAGVTTADFGGNIQVGNVQVQDATHARVDLAVTAGAPVGYVTARLTTRGEIAQLGQAFTVVPGTPTLNEVSATQAQQGQTLTAVRVLGQYTHYCDNAGIACGSGFTPTTVTFGQGITISNLHVVSASEVDVDLSVDPIAFTGSRDVTVTTGTETASRYSLFQITPGGALLQTVAPASANQGQEVVLQLTGVNTHWQQGLTQFSISGGGYDIAVNNVVINSPTSATADVTVSPTAGLGARGVYMVTGGEALSNSGALVVTGGIPAIAGISPGSIQAGQANVNVVITGLFTDWLEGGVSQVDFGTAQGSGINLISYTVNSDTSITAVINVGPGAPLQYEKVTVTGQTKNQNGVLGVQALTGNINIYSPAPPVPYIRILTPSAAIPGQTLNVNLYGENTHWDLSSQITFGAGIEVLPGTFSVTSPTTALATIRIDDNATGGSRQVIVDTGAEEEQAYFSVVIAQPRLVIVDPGSGLQGAQNLEVNVIGAYTQFNSTTQFQFSGAGVTVVNTQILGPTIAHLTLNLDQLAPLGGRSVSATTTLADSSVESDTGAGFSVTPSLATILSVAPNTGYQGNGAGNGAAIQVTVSGEFTHWDATTAFQFGDGITVSNIVVNSANQTATMDVAIPPLAGLGATWVRATTGGEVATLNNAFVVQAGTPIILSASTGSGAAVVEQQQTVPVTILGQVTQWDSTTTVTFGAGFLVSTPVSGNLNCTGSLNPGQTGMPLVTGPTAMTVCVTALPLTNPGVYTLTVVTGGQLLTLPNTLYVQRGPAAVTAVAPNSGNQGQTLDVALTGTNTNFSLTPGVSTASFGAGINVNSLTVTSATTATANITIAADAATASLRTVVVNTLGEQAVGSGIFQVIAATPVLTFVSPASVGQGAAATVNVSGLFTHFTNATVFNFGPGVQVNSVNAASGTAAAVQLTVLPTAATGARTVTATSGTEVAQGTGLFSIAAGPATLAAVSPSSGRQNQSGEPVLITGAGTHFTAATPSVSFGSGITVTQVTVTDDTHLTAILNVDVNASTGARNVTVATGGEIATLAGGFTVTAGLPVLTGANPAIVHQNDNLAVTVTGLFTHFVPGTTTAGFSSADLSATSVSVSDATHAVVQVQVSPTATLGTSSITLATGTETAPGTGLLTIVAGLPQLTAVAPNTGAQAATVTLTVTGLYTHFQQGVSQVALGGGGITVGAVTVNGPTQLQVPVTVANGAAAGLRSLTVTTNSETETLAGAFTVLPGAPAISILSPNGGVANSTATVQITGQFTHFVQGTTVASFGAGIAVGGGAMGGFGPVTVNSPTSATASLTIDPAAVVGPRDVNVQTGAELLLVSSGFTVQTTSPTAPVLSATSPLQNTGNVPTNPVITMAFSAPLNRATVGTDDVLLMDTSSYGCNSWQSAVPATVTVDASGRVITVTPTAVLAVGRQYAVCLNYPNNPGNRIADPNGLQVSWQAWYFTTGFGPDNNGPSFVVANLLDGATQVGTNAPVTLQFDRPVNPIGASSYVSVTQGGNPVPGTWGANQNSTQLTFRPTAAFAPSTTFQVTYGGGLQSLSGIGLLNPGSFSFTTGTGSDNSAPGYLVWTPRSSETTGTNVIVTGVLSEPLDPISLSVGNNWVRNQATGATVAGVQIQLSPDRRTLSLTLPGPLDPGTNYNWRTYGADPAGNYFSGSDSFVTSTGAVSAAPLVTSTSPAANATGVAVNTQVAAQFGGNLDATSVSAGSITLSPAAAGSTSLAGDNRTLTFTPSGALATSTTYTATVSGVRDTQGNTISNYSWSFTTGASSTPDTTHGTIHMTPADGSTNVPVNAQVIAVLSKPVNPDSININSAYVYDRSVSGQPKLTGTFSVSADGLTLTYAAPSGGLPPNHQLCAAVSWNASLYDYAGNTFNGAYQCFTTASTADTTPPTVVAVMPANNATGIGPNNPITVTFSEPMSPALLTNNQNVALYDGSTLLTTGLSLSPDATSVTFNGLYLPYGHTITVVVNPAVTDLAGNAMGTEFSSSFTVMNRPVTSQPSVTAFRPGAGASGVAATVTPTFYLSQAIDPGTVANAMLVSQNGALVSGGVQVSASGQVVTFTPAAPFQAGAVVQIWFTSAATDPSGNPLVGYQTSFSIAPDRSGAAPNLVSLSPDRYLPDNGVIDMQFDQPLAPGSVTGASVYLRQGGGGAIQAATLSLLAGNTVVRLAPASALAPSTTYCLFLTTGITNPASIAYAGTERCYTSAAGPDTSPLSVTAMAPTNGSLAIGVNALIRVTFSKAMEYLTITPDTLQLSSNGTPIPYTFSLDGPGSTLTLTPQSPLPASAPVTVHVTSGVTDYTGQGAADFTATFQTGAAPVYSVPQVLSSSVADGDTNVPVTAVFTVSFDRPLDTRSVNAANLYLNDNFIGARVGGTVTTSPDATQVTFTPSAPLALGRQYSFRGCSLTDLNGNSACWNFYYTFTTALTAPAGGPQVVITTPAAGFTGQPVNLMPEIEFDRPVARATAANIQLLQNGSTPVAFTTAFGNSDRLVQIVPTAVLQPNTAYTLHITGVTDASGSAMSAPVDVAFTTGGGFDLVAPQVVQVTPVNGATTGTHPVLKVVFNEPVDPIRNSGWYLRNQSAGSAWATNLQVHYSPDRTVMTLTFDPLQANSNYNWGTGSVYDAAGNSTSYSYNFLTNAGSDTTAPAVVSATPPNGATGVPLNAVVQLQLSQPLDPTTVGSGTVSLSPAAAGATSLNGSGTLLTFTPSAALAPNTVYTVSAGGAADLSGNAMTPYTAGFTTAGAVLSGNGTAGLTSPAPNAIGVDVNTALHLSFSRPADPLSVNSDALSVEARVNNTWVVVATQITLSADGLSATLTPLAPLPGNAQIWVGVSYYANLLDLSGNSFSGLQVYFNTGAPAAAVPQVMAVTPGDGATGVGPNAVVTLQFNESLNPATINNSNFALYNGYTNLGPSVNRSSDNRTVTLSTTLPYGATITVSVGTGVTDVAGNPMAAPFRSSFSTIPYPHTATPGFNEMRPGNGASGVPLTSVITLYAGAPINPASLAGNVLVTENGSAWDGTAALAGSGQAIVFTPTTPFDPGALVQIFISGGLTDVYGNHFNSFSASFRTQPDLTGAALTLISNPQNSGNNPTNTAVEMEFNKPINPATLTSASFYLVQSGNPVAATLSQPEPNVIRLQPTTALLPNSYYVFYLTSALQDTTGMSYGSGGWGLWTGAGPDTALPGVVSVVPQSGTTGVGDNASLRVTFSKAMDANSVNPNTLQLSTNGQPLAYSLSLGSLSNGATVAVVQPQAPLPDGGPVTLTLSGGIGDYEGNAITPLTSTFTTGYGSDYASPQLVYSSPTPDANQNLPLSAVFTYRFNEPLDVTRLSGSLRNYTAGQYVPFTLQLSPDGTTITLIPTGGMAASSQNYGCVTVYDLAGNGGNGYCAWAYTAAAPDPSLPQAVVTAPMANETGVPTNTLIDILFSKPLALQSPWQVTLSANGNPVAQQVSLVNAGTVVRITPGALLAPNTVYTVAISGFTDLGGNAMAGTFSYQFTTGPNPDLSNSTSFQTASATVSGVATQLSTNSTLAGVDTGTSLTVTFSAPVMAPWLWTNGAVQLVNTNTSAVIPVTLALSTDGRTLTLTPQAPLAGATGYTLRVNYYATVYALPGYNVSGYGLFKFTTP